MRVDLPRTWPDFYPFALTRVVDGDTVRGRISLPFDHSFEAIVRLKEFYADELDGPFASQGLKAQARLEEWFEDRHVLLKCGKPRLDRYGRVLAFLWSEGKVWSPGAILGGLALTKQEHARRLSLRSGAHRSLRAAQSATRPAGASPIPTVIGTEEVPGCLCGVHLGVCPIHDADLFKSPATGQPGAFQPHPSGATTPRPAPGGNDPRQGASSLT